VKEELRVFRPAPLKVFEMIKHAKERCSYYLSLRFDPPNSNSNAAWLVFCSAEIGNSEYYAGYYRQRVCH
jgi:hypothetical protein